MSADPWTCPACGRSFGRVGQSHSCAPAGTLDESFTNRPDWQRQAYERIAAHLRSLGPVVIEPVSVGVFFKRARSFAEVRPMKTALRVEFLLSRHLDDPRVVKSLPMSANRIAAFVDLRSPDEVDHELLAWMTEAYASSPV
jgi:hypothetical protein